MYMWNMIIKRTLFVMAFLSLVTFSAQAQKYPERREVRRGNRSFEKEQYDGAIERYRRALSLAEGCWEAKYNLGNALYEREMRHLKQETAQPSTPVPLQTASGEGSEVATRFDEAVQLLQAAALDSLRTPQERAEAYYNLGGVQFAQQKLQESLKSLRNSLKLNPADEEAKFNYTYVKRLLDQQQEQQQNQSQDQQQDQQQDQSQDQSQNQPQDSPQESSQEQQEESQTPQQPQEGVISPQEQEQMLDAIQAQEDETQEKLKERRGVVVRGKKNW